MTLGRCSAFRFEANRNKWVCALKDFTLCILVDLQIHIDTIRIGFSIIYMFRGHREKFLNYYELQSLTSVFIIVNSVYPDVMQHSLSSLFSKIPLSRVSNIQRVNVFH